MSREPWLSGIAGKSMEIGQDRGLTIPAGFLKTSPRRANITVGLSTMAIDRDARQKTPLGVPAVFAGPKRTQLLADTYM